MQLYDSRARAKRPFQPLVDGRVGIYVCGPTVYDHPHLGHARMAVAFDVIRRTFVALGYHVTYVSNITDVDDKIIARAAEEGAPPFEIAERYTRSYDDAMRALGVLPPQITPRATGHITDMIDLIARLIEAGAAYAVDGGDVYFAVDHLASYGSLSNRSLEDMRAGERVEPDPRKRHPMDFALWKGAKPGEISWPAPWGAGRPGWHIECSAMSMKYLGDTFDIHGGGQDLLFPHHENEAAQSEAATGAPLANVWLHNGFITVDSEKMSKSLGNFVTLSDILARYPAPAVRTLLVSIHYRSPLEMSPAVLDEARAVWDRFAGFARNAARVTGPEPGEPDPVWRERFLDALRDDVNTPEAFAVLHAIVTEATPAVDAGDAATLRPLYAAFRWCASVLGLDPEGDWSEAAANARVAPLVDHLLAERAAARAAKDFARADAIRDVLAASGVVVEDRPDGARWFLEDPWR
jgi:cysteinyl-tRNA synthetase